MIDTGAFPKFVIIIIIILLVLISVQDKVLPAAEADESMQA